MIVLADERIFHTIQGEGKYVGYPCSFIRMSRCNLRCAWKNKDGSITRCDTPHTSFNPEVTQYKISDIVTELDNEGFEHVIISGGEPYFQPNLACLVDGLKSKHFITIETNGTIYRDTNADFISISPKLSCSSEDLKFGKMHDKRRINLDSLTKFITNHENYQFKFVINTENDVTEVLEIRKMLFERTSIDINEHIWIMPQGIEVKQLDEKMVFLVNLCKTYNWKLTDRLHIRIWGSIKGV